MQIQIEIEISLPINLVVQVSRSNSFALPLGPGYNSIRCFMFLWPCIVSKAWRKNTNKMQQYRWFIVSCRCWLLTTVSTCFGHLYAHHQEKRPRVTAYGVYLLAVLDVAGCGTVVLRWSHPQRSTTVPQPATSNTTSKYTPYAVTHGLFSWQWA